jgi:DNA-binding response OmpR family regulator/nitrogen-specific signal transduction histidine kinase/AraC-like DNA-binding protein
LVERSRLLKAQVAERTMELKQRAATIERLLEDKEKLFANISHEFRTPLTLILGPLDAELKKATDESSRNLLSLAKANGQRLLAMVDQLLDLARVNDHQVQTKVAKDVVNACDFLVASYDSLAQERGLSLRFDNQLVQPVSVDMLEDALEKILSNLLTNALKYSKADGVITLKLAIATAGFVQISVTDTGQGISPDDQQHIFKRFTRVDNANGYMPGVGIGLALIKELISQHQGTIAVQSELGTGSVFTVTLPLSDNQNNSTSEVNEALVLSAVGKTKLDQRPLAKLSEVQPMIIGDKPDDNLPGILVIEDNAEMRQYIVACLSGRFHCTSAVDGEQGVAMAREMLPDLVISDVMMPKMNGFEVTKCLKGDDLTSHIPLILLTAQGDRESRLKGWAENADEFLQKPFNTDELLIRIDNLLSIRSLLRQRYQRAFTEPKAQNASSSSLSSPLPSLLPSNITAEIGVARVTESANHGSLAEEEADQETAVNIVHQAFIDRVNEVLELNYTDEAFDVGQFAAQMALSGRQFSRKMKTLLDLSPVESIRSFRLKKAAEQLASGVTPSTVSHQVGFASHSYFSQCFKAQYNCLPSHYADAE